MMNGSKGEEFVRKAMGEPPEREQRNKSEECGHDGDAIRAAPIDERTANRRAEELTDAEEHRVHSHNRAAIFGVFFGNIGEVRERGGGKAALNHDTDAEQQCERQHKRSIERGLVIDGEHKGAGQKQPAGADQHRRYPFHISKQHAPD